MNIEKAILAALPDLESSLRRSMHRGLREKMPIADIVQETYVKAIEHIDAFEYRGEASLRAWLNVIAKNIVCGNIRRRQSNELGELVESIIESGLLRPSEIARNRETVEKLRKELLRLPSHYREILKGRYVQSFSFEEIAGATGRTSGAVRGIHRNAIERLQRIFDVSHLDE